MSSSPSGTTTPFRRTHERSGSYSRPDPQHAQGGLAVGAWRGRGCGGGLGLLRGRRNPDDSSRDDDRHPRRRMGRVPRSDPREVGRCLGAIGAVGFPSEAAQAPARPEEAEAQKAERGQDQTCCHREDSQSASYVYKMTPPKGWFISAYLHALSAQAIALNADSPEAHESKAEAERLRE